MLTNGALSIFIATVFYLDVYKRQMQNYMTVLREDPLLAGRESRWESPFDSLTERNAGI